MERRTAALIVALSLSPGCFEEPPKVESGTPAAPESSSSSSSSSSSGSTGASDSSGSGSGETTSEPAGTSTGGWPCNPAWLGDGECDEPEGTNLCPEGTDFEDCICDGDGASTGELADECTYANDGECDVPNVCPLGTDVVDCLCGGTTA